MDLKEEVDMVAQRGIKDNANQGGRRQVTIIEKEIWEQMMGELGASLDPSSRRANLLISGHPLINSRRQNSPNWRLPYRDQRRNKTLQPDG